MKRLLANILIVTSVHNHLLKNEVFLTYLTEDGVDLGAQVFRHIHHSWAGSVSRQRHVGTLLLVAVQNRFLGIWASLGKTSSQLLF